MMFPARRVEMALKPSILMNVDSSDFSSGVLPGV
jgi:hypothetical protein